jgi:hypothetical protein
MGPRVADARRASTSSADATPCWAHDPPALVIIFMTYLAG